MPKRKLSDIFVRRAKPEAGKQIDHWDTEVTGLSLRIGSTGKLTWLFAYRHGGKSRKMVIGYPPAMSLAMAREIAGAHRRAAQAGLDPAEEKRGDGRPQSFTELAARYMRKHARRHKRTAAEDLRMLQRYVKPTLGRKRPAEVTKGDILELLRPIEDARHMAQADAILVLLKHVFNWAVENELVDRNPAEKMKRRAKPKVRTRFLSVDELRCFWFALDTLPIEPVVRDVLRLLVLTGQRASEVIDAERHELTLNGPEPMWTIPSRRTKNKREHRLPLSSVAVALFNNALGRSTSSSLVFPGRPGRSLTDGVARRAIHRALTAGLLKYKTNEASKIVERKVEKFGPHDLRRTMATLMVEFLDIDETVVGRILNHARTGVTAVHYAHATKLRQMRDATNQWAGFVESLSASNVLRF